MVWYSRLLKNFPPFAVKSFRIVNEAEVDVFSGILLLFYDPTDVGNLISGFSVFSKPSLDIWKFLVPIMLKASMQDIKYDLTSMGDECNYPMV